MKKIVNLWVAFVLLTILGSCAFTKTGIVKTTTQTIPLDLRCNAVPDNQYYDLTKGLNIEVTSSVSDSQILDYSSLDSKSQKAFQNINVIVDPTIKTFVANSLSSYVRSMGINVGRDVNNDLILQVRVVQFRYVMAETSGRAVIELDYQLLDNNREVLLHQVARGREIFDIGKNPTSLSSIFEKAYGMALSDIDWNGIANYLKINKRADQEQQKKVKGDGNTALEHTIIRWYVVSSPPGADVYWRIVSSTPDVKNTNSAYLGTTPYEATESFSVRGLDFENSGNVQVEIVCEKPGYLTQSRRFNLRQAIEQREISTKFNLIKDE